LKQLIADIAAQAAACGTVPDAEMASAKRKTEIDDPALRELTHYMARVAVFPLTPPLSFINLLSPVKANIKPCSILFWIFDHEIILYKKKGSVPLIFTLPNRPPTYYMPSFIISASIRQLFE